MKRFIILSALAVLTAVSCNKQNEKIIYEGTALGVEQPAYFVESEAGTVHIDVISNREYTIACDAPWASMPSTAAAREGFDVRYDANDGVSRVATITLSISAAHADTVQLRQKGLLIPELELDTDSFFLDGSHGGSQDVVLSTNLLDSEIFLDVNYSDAGANWLKAGVKSSVLRFSYENNPSEFTRSAQIVLSYVDQNGRNASLIVYVSQKTASDKQGTEISLAELKALATVDGTLVEDDLIVEGVVVSNKESLNMGDNTQLSVIGIDYSVTQRTVYLQSPDGSCGVRILTDSADDNVFSQFDRVRLSLRGSVIYTDPKADPDREPALCHIRRFNAYQVLYREAGEPVVKEKYISELSDDDIYTYVTLKDCQLPFRKGSLSPVDERLTNAANVNKIGKFPILLTDSQGASIYLYTNTTCPYRRDGHRLPYGSGSMKGVVVFELYPRFIYQDNNSGDEDTYGNIGRYQLRHTGLGDFEGLADTMAERSFSDVVAEWRYVTAANQEKYYATDGDRTAYFKHSSANTVGLYDDFSYLGPVGTTPDGYFGMNAGNINGLGVILEDGTDWMGPDYTGVNSQYAEKVNNISSAPGSGVSPSTAGAAWYTNVNYTSGTNTPQGLILYFNGEKLGGGAALYLSMCSLYVSTYTSTGPRDFNLEYSVDGGKAWTRFASFILPDLGVNSNPITQMWQISGYKQMDFALPAQLSGVKDARIRIFPDSKIRVGSYTEYVTDNIPKNTIPRTIYNYIGIRTNK